MRLKLNNVLCFVFIVLATISCSSSKGVGKSTKKNKKNSVYNFQVPDQKKFTGWLKFKSDLSLDLNGEKNTLDAQFRILQNETIWVSVSKLSFPIAKLLLTKDSVFMVDLFNKKYLKETYLQVSSRIGTDINFSLLQNMLLGQIIKQEIPNYSWFINNELQLSTASKENIKLDSTNQNVNSAAYSIQQIDTSSKTLKSFLYVIPAKKEKLMVTYLEMDTSLTYSLPSKVNVSVFKNTELKMMCNFIHQKIELLPDVKTPFEIPKNYVKME